MNSINWKVFDLQFYGCFMDNGDYPSDYYGTAYFSNLKDAWDYYKDDTRNRYPPKSKAAHPDSFAFVD